jgi:Domain of unknown function (DUF4124)
MTRSRHCLWVLGCSVVAWCALASAQTFYKWTDDAGVVHFADEPPANAQGVEQRDLPAAPVVKSRIEPAEENGEAAAKEGTEAKAAKPEGPKPEGPARVILVSRQNPRTGPSAMHFVGKVKNVGGEAARQVAVTISAVDSTQGTPCLNEQTAVTPSTLGPGETGNFDVDVDSPCLYGEPNVDVAPVWD